MWNATLTTPPTAELAELEELREQCELGDDPTHDPKLLRLLSAATKFCERYRREQFLTATYTLRLGSLYQPELLWERGLRIPIKPLQSAGFSISYVDLDGATQTLDAERYWVRPWGVWGLVEPAYGLSWPAARCQTAAVTITCQAGYGDTAAAVPEDFRLAVLELVATKFRLREATSDVAETEVPFAVRALLDNGLMKGWGY